MTYYEAVKAALATIGVSYFHNKAHKQDGEYIVWSETPTSGLIADGRIQNRAQRIAVDFFTKTEYSATPVIIQKALESVGYAVSPRIEPIYEETTGYTHYALTAVWY